MFVRLLVRSLVAWLVLGTASVVCAVGVARAATDRPNLVLIIGDDHGWPDAGFMGHPVVQTPNLDALAASGTTFTHAQNTASVCAPSLRTLLAAVHTTQWEAKRVALEAELGDLRRRTEVAHYRTLPRELARQGYLSWEGGKHWEGTFAQAGFTHGLATSVSTNVFTAVGDQFGRENWSSGTALAPLQAFLDEAGSAPFFLWLAPALPHLPYDAPALFRTPYENLGLLPAEVGYYANVSWLDAFVGAVLAELDARGLRDDTLVVYVSDNGAAPGPNSPGAGKAKGTLYELGFRTPLIFSLPGRVPAGVVRDDLVSTLDVPATLLDYGGGDALDDGGARSLRTALETGAPAGGDRLAGLLPGGTPESNGVWVRTHEWRYLRTADGHEELYRIDLDPYEDVDVAAEHPELLPAFRADAAAFQSALTTARPLLDAAGRLADELGVPIAGEPVELRGRARDGSRVRLRVMTSARGDFLFESVPHGEFTIVCRRCERATVFGRPRGHVPVTLPQGTLGAYVALRGPQVTRPRAAGRATVLGRVTGAGGAPQAGIDVALRRTGRGPAVKVMVRTDADGRFRAESLHAGTYRVILTPARGARVRTTATVGEAQTVELAIAMPG